MTEEKFEPLSIASDEVATTLAKLPDEVLANFSFPLFSGGSERTLHKPDADGFPSIPYGALQDLHEYQKRCREKAESNPQINSHIRDFMGRMTGWGFNFSSDLIKVNQIIEEIMEDPRNDLYQYFPKFVARTEMEGELFIMFSLHTDGFVEVDFLAPEMIRGGGDKNSGIIFHPTKQTFPLFYFVQFDDIKVKGYESAQKTLIPSINIAYYPELEKIAKEHKDFDEEKLRLSKVSPGNPDFYNKFNGYYRFIVHWNKGFMTRRNVSHIRTTIEWVNYYEALKKYEIDHKKSSGAYLWVITMEDIQAFRRWLSLTEEEREKTGIMKSKEPGGTLVLPPGMNLSVQNPSLPNISDQDTDIMQMITSGLQKPQDVVLGDYRSTYASVKASQGPQGDRINDELHYFKIFLTYSFWRPIFYLRSIADPSFKFHRYVRRVVRFEKGKPVYGRIKKAIYKFVDISLPTSRLEDIEAIAKSMLGSKHGSIVETLGIPRREVARRLGFTNYANLRKEKAIEDEEFPATLSVENEEADQERREGEQPKEENKKEESKKRTRKKPTNDE